MFLFLLLVCIGNDRQIDQFCQKNPQTVEEGLKESLLSVVTASDNVTLDVLNEVNLFNYAV